MPVGQAEAIGESELLSVDSDLATIDHHLNNLVAFTRIEGPESCVLRVAVELIKSKITSAFCGCLVNAFGRLDHL